MPPNSSRWLEPMLAPLSPLDAYRFDLDRQHRRSEFGNADTVWLLLAHCLGRISKVGDAVRDQLALQSANALRDLAESAPDGDAHEGAHINDLRMMIAGLSAIETRAGADAVSRACRGFAARMAESGALSVAYSVIGFARTVAADASDRERHWRAVDRRRAAFSRLAWTWGHRPRARQLPACTRVLPAWPQPGNERSRDRAGVLRASGSDLSLIHI